MVSVSKARIFEFKKSDDEIRQAVLHHTERMDRQDARMDEQDKQIAMLAGWAGNFERVSAWRRLRWLITGR